MPRPEDGSWRCRTPVKNVAIVGGTHGNERQGVHMIKHYLKNPHIVARPSFNTKVLIANEAAVANIGTGAGTRYVEEDLNRCFSNHRLGGGGVTDTCEMRRARELDAMLGPKDSAEPQMDYLFDLHNTTANTGVLLCYHGEDTFSADLCAHLQSLDPAVKLLQWPSGMDLGLLPTVARGGMTVEVGPLAHSTVDSKMLHKTMDLIAAALDWVNGRNEGSITAGGGRHAKAFASVGFVDFPRDEEGEIAGFIHENLQGICELSPEAVLQDGMPAFRMMDGTVIEFSRQKHCPSLVGVDADLYPAFVNEAAYYEQGKAFVLCKKVQ